MSEYNLSAREKSLRDQFVLTYFDDYDYIGACVRIGFPKALAYEWAIKFKYDPYVQNKIAEAERIKSDDPEATIEFTKNKILNALMREAHYSGGKDASHTARVNALAKLANLHGMDAPTRIQQNIDQNVKQETEVKIKFDFESLTTEQRDLYRQLLTSLKLTAESNA